MAGNACAEFLRRAGLDPTDVSLDDRELIEGRDGGPRYGSSSPGASTKTAGLDSVLALVGDQQRAHLPARPASSRTGILTFMCSHFDHSRSGYERAHSEATGGSEGGAALVTGASRGLGAAMARQLAADGWSVAVNYRSGAEDAAAVVRGIRAGGGTAEAFRADVTDEDSVADLAEQVTASLGPVRALVLNATGPQPFVAVEDLTWEAHLDQLRFFVKSPTLLLRAVLPGMKSLGSGRVIQIGSDIFERALPGMSAYVAAKGAQLGLTRSWARELGPHGITVNLIAPGWVPVERHASATEDELLAHASEVPLRRTGTPADVASTVSFLASDAAKFITGERIAVNGGHTTS